MDEDGEESFVATDLLEVNMVEDASDSIATVSKEGSCNDFGQESNIRPEDSVNRSNGYAKSAAENNVTPNSNLDAVRIAWGMGLEEDMFYKDLFKDEATVRFLRLHCTVCDTHLGCKPGSVLMRHVRLGTLICKACYIFYGAGEFPIAEDGSESFCYWCGQGGSVVCCSSCSAVFCKKCIRLNYTKSTQKEIESSSEWLCFVCNYRSLWEHRAVCRAAITYESSETSALEEDDTTSTAPGHNQEFCCAPDAVRRIARLKSSMPSEVTFGELIKSGRVKASVMKMMKSIEGKMSDCISLDSNETVKTGKIISDDTASKTLANDPASKEVLSSEQSVTNNHTNKTEAQASVTSHNLSYLGVAPYRSETQFPSNHSQPSTGYPFLNQGIRSNVTSDPVIPNRRVVVMPPVRVPQRASVIRLPAVTVAQQSSSLDALSLGALLNSSSPVSTIPQQNPVFRFQNGPMPVVVVSDSSRVTGLPIVVRNSHGAYVPMYVNNSATFHGTPKESGHISGVPYYVQNQAISAMISQNTQQGKFGNNTTFLSNSVCNNTATYQPHIAGHTSQNASGMSLVHTEKANTNYNEKSKTNRGYIQVRSPTALQSVTVSDIEHSSSAVSASVSCKVPEQQSILTSLLSGFPSGTTPSTPTVLTEEQTMHNVLLTKTNQERGCPLNNSITSPITGNLTTTSLLKSHLPNISHSSNPKQNISDSSNQFRGIHSRQEIPQDCVVNESSTELSSRTIDALETNWFKENLLEAENVAKYMLTRVTCVQEDLDSKSRRKRTFDDMVNHFSTFLEIASKKLSDVSRNFAMNLHKWKALSPSCLAGFPEATCADSKRQRNVETKDGQSNAQAVVHSDTSCEEVEIISAKVPGKKRSREQSNLGLEIHSPVTHTLETGPGSTITHDATKSAICTHSSKVAQGVKEKASRVTTYRNLSRQPSRTIIRRSKGTRTTTGFLWKCCTSSCESDLQTHSKHEDSQQNVGSLCNKSEKLLEQEKDLHIPEKRMKLKEVRIVLERIHYPGKIAFKTEPNESNLDNRGTSVNNAQSLGPIETMKGQGYQGPATLVKNIKPCSVVISRLSI